MIELTDQNFHKEVMENSELVLVDFYTNWCPPCKVLAPVLEKLSKEFEGKITFKKINIDSSPIVSQQFGIESIPTIVVFKNGKPLDGFVGALPEQTVREWLGKICEIPRIKQEKEPLEKNQPTEPIEEQKIEEMIKEYQALAHAKGLKLNPDSDLVRNLMKGLLENEKKYGFRYCPCRRVTGKKEEDEQKICICQFSGKEISEKGRCLCGLFVK